jgi:hypothetical protein
MILEEAIGKAELSQDGSIFNGHCISGKLHQILFLPNCQGPPGAHVGLEWNDPVVLVKSLHSCTDLRTPGQIIGERFLIFADNLHIM